VNVFIVQSCPCTCVRATTPMPVHMRVHMLVEVKLRQRVSNLIATMLSRPHYIMRYVLRAAAVLFGAIISSTAAQSVQIPSYR